MSMERTTFSKMVDTSPKQSKPSQAKLRQAKPNRLNCTSMNLLKHAVAEMNCNRNNEKIGNGIKQKSAIPQRMPAIKLQTAHCKKKITILLNFFLFVRCCCCLQHIKRVRKHFANGLLKRGIKMHLFILVGIVCRFFCCWRTNETLREKEDCIK